MAVDRQRSLLNRLRRLLLQLRKNPFAYQDKPRLGTALALLRASSSIEQRLDEVSRPGKHSAPARGDSA